MDAVELNVWAFNISAIKFYSSLGMSVKNMKLEKILSTSDVEQENISINITSNVKVEKHQQRKITILKKLYQLDVTIVDRKILKYNDKSINIIRS